MKTLNFKYDQKFDILEIEGIKYSGEIFRLFAFTDTDRKFKFKKDEFGALTFWFIDD